METFKAVVILIFLVVWFFSVFDFIKGNGLAYKYRMSFLLFLNLSYFFFLIYYFLGKGNFDLNRYSEMYLILSFLLLIFFFIQEFIFRGKSLNIFFIPIVSYIMLLGFFFLSEETRILSFNLLISESFNYLVEVAFLAGVILFFYELILSILYRQLFLAYKLKRNKFLLNRLPRMDVLEKLINFNLIAGCLLVFIKVIFVVYFFFGKVSLRMSLFDFLNGFGVVFIFCFFLMIVFFRLNSWLHSRGNLRWAYFGNGLVVFYFLILY